MNGKTVVGQAGERYSMLVSGVGPGEFDIQINPAQNLYAANMERLLERAQALDPQALSQIHDRYYPVIYRYARYRLEDEAIVEDISSEVFLRLIDHLHRQKGEIRELRGWLFGIAANLINDHLRKKYRQPMESLGEHETLASGDDPHRSAEHHERQNAVRQAMHRLTKDQQHVLALRFSQELSVEETARMMNKSAGAVKVLQFRALAALRKLVNSGGKDI